MTIENARVLRNDVAFMTYTLVDAPIGMSALWPRHMPPR